MDDARNSQEPTEVIQANEAEAIAQLLRLAGPRPRVPAEREARLRSAAYAHWSTGVRRGKRLRWAVWTSASLAAASLLVFVATLRGWRVLDILPVPGSVVAKVLRVEGFLNVPASQVPAAGADLKSGTILETQTGDRIALQMQGGAMVRVDSGTKMRLISPSSIDLDSGAIYVDSGSSGKAGTPLEIRTRLGTVRDVGTQFQVRVGQGGIQVSVRQGIARLEREGASHQATAGIELSLKDDGVLSSRTIPSTGGQWDWILGLTSSFQLEGSPLGEYLEWIERETGLRVEFKDPSLEEEARPVILHGSVEGLRPEETLGAVLPTCGMAFEIDGDALTIRRGSKSAP